MPTREKEPLKISGDELSSDKVEAKLQRLDAVARAREQYDKPVVQASLPSKSSKFAFLYNTLVYMALFGAAGGMVGYAFGEIMNFRTDPRIERDNKIHAYEDLKMQRDTGRLPAIAADGAMKEIARSAKWNDYMKVYFDNSLSADEKTAAMKEIEDLDTWKVFIGNVLFFGISGMMISTFLSAAESVVSRNARGAILNGSVGAAMGLIGGVVISLFYDQLYRMLVGQFGEAADEQSAILVRSITWGILGLFISIAPGLLMRNFKRLVVGAAGGLIGGLIGGALFDPILQATDEHISRLVAIVTIGLAAGLGTGLLENAIKSGWIKVKEGLIAGKQFVLYRNPTYIGSAPNCHVYLFKDPKVGRRHAAIHVVPGGFEIEDLPLGDRTRVNGNIITRSRLKLGDKIQVGSTVFEFHEKAKVQKA
ncbi:hypothetical protein BH10PLA1_BH10PLA1_17730 [soil metagenome]